MSKFSQVRAFLLSALVLPGTALCIRAYLHNHPLPQKKTRTIRSTETIYPSCASSPSFRIVNPRNHIAMKDSYSINLAKHEIMNLNDEEILARFINGFFGGWIFTPERTLFAILGLFGMKFVPVGFSGTYFQIFHPCMDVGIVSKIAYISTRD